MIVDLFWICVVILGSGWLYFYVARPILEAYNIVGPLESVNGLGVEESTQTCYVKSRDGETSGTSASGPGTRTRYPA
jgi:hypothetical protein